MGGVATPVQAREGRGFILMLRKITLNGAHPAA